MRRLFDTLGRVLRHRWLDETDVRRALPQAVMDRLEARVAASERRHGGEIRVCVEAGLPLSYLWRGLRARDRAITLFGKLRVWDTEHNSGVLIYLLLAEHAIEIVADRGLNRHVTPAQWQAVLQGMQAAFRAGRYEQGLNEAVDAVERLLVEHFPLAPEQARANELPNRPWTG
ncbi:MAG: TPM domain-containing protein [Burkholderiales bacterium]|nr:TPM domain-containing protein [Burkholderiales bacterium]